MAGYFGDGDDVCVLDAHGALTRPFVTAQAGEVATRGQDAHLGIQHSAAHFTVDGDADGHLEVALASEQPARDTTAAGSPRHGRDGPLDTILLHAHKSNVGNVLRQQVASGCRFLSVSAHLLSLHCPP
jgi:hypothetical protein